MRTECYILEGTTPKPVSFLTWVQWFNPANRRVKHDTFGEILVSTVFFGINHILFETMILGGDYDGERQRYSTYAEAEIGHAIMCAKVMDDATVLDAEIIY